MSSPSIVEFLAKAAVPVAVALVFALVRRDMSAAKLKPPAEAYSRGDLDIRFNSVQWLVGAGTAQIGILFALGSYGFFLRMNRFLVSFDGPANFWIWPQSAIWWFFPGFGALALSWELVLQSWACFGKCDEANLYGYWSSEKIGFDSRKRLRWMAILIALPIGILTVLALPMHTALRQDDIKDCGYAFAQCKVYRYAAARRMTVVEGPRNHDGKFNRRPGIVIDFSDGRRWSSADESDFSKFVDLDFAMFPAT
jgi:hypothetical protein